MSCSAQLVLYSKNSPWQLLHWEWVRLHIVPRISLLLRPPCKAQLRIRVVFACVDFHVVQEPLAGEFPHIELMVLSANNQRRFT